MAPTKKPSTALKNLSGRMNCLAVEYAEAFRHLVPSYDPLNGYDTPAVLQETAGASSTKNLMKPDTHLNKFFNYVVDTFKKEVADHSLTAASAKTVTASKCPMVYNVRQAALWFNSVYGAALVTGAAQGVLDLLNENLESDPFVVKILHMFFCGMAVAGTQVQIMKHGQTVSHVCMIDYLILMRGSHTKCDAEILGLITLMQDWRTENIKPPAPRAKKESGAKTGGKTAGKKTEKEEEAAGPSVESTSVDTGDLGDF
ncbi:hypothetical protein KDA11_05535 [Candidatus Saccharibacteria bacterium]|nr:hypothetical protein [Candidatus Saccharibacteria bacterium]